jgi:thiol-disulfide isomerase/thioredoxin
LAHCLVSFVGKIQLPWLSALKLSGQGRAKKLITHLRKRYTSYMNNLLKKTLLPLIILGLLTFLGLQLNNKPSAPNVVFTTIDGTKISMASLKGKVVLVNFWATDCPGCIKEMPQLISTYNQYNKQGFELIAVAMPDDPPAQVFNYTQQKNLPFPVMHDGLSEISSQFGDVSLTPTAFIYDQQGYLLQRTIGELDFKALHQLLNTKLNYKKDGA